MKPRILAIVGSPRKGGNTETLVRAALAAAKEEGATTKMISLRNKKVEGCRARFKCGEKKDAKCHGVKDDFGPIFEEIKKADGIIFASPVYFGSATPAIKAVMERAGMTSKRNGELLAGKVGGPIVAARRAGTLNTYSQLAMFYPINGMILVGADYWNIGYGLEPGSVKNDKDAFVTVEKFGANLARLLKKLAD